MSWDRWFGKMEGLPNGRIGETPRHPRNGTDPGTFPKAKYDSSDSRVVMRVVIEKTGGRDPVGLAQIGMFRSILSAVSLWMIWKILRPVVRGEKT